MSNIGAICDCYKGLVGLRGICEASEDCSLYLNQLPGISNALMADITDLDRQTIKQVFADIETRAAVAMNTCIEAKIKGKFRQKKQEGITVSGRFDDLSGELQELDGEHLYGHYINLSDSNFNQLDILEFRIYSEFPITEFSFYIFNASTRRLIHEVETSLDVGINIIQLEPCISFSIKADDLFIAIDGGTVQTLEPKTKANCDCGCHSHSWRYERCDKCDCNCDCGGCVKMPKTGAVDSSTVLRVEELSSADCRFVICYQKKCSWSAFICQNKNDLKIPFWYMLGIEFWNEPEFPQKYLGTFQMITDEQRERKIEHLQGLFDKAIANFVSNITVVDTCFECEETVTVETLIP